MEEDRSGDVWGDMLSSSASDNQIQYTIRCNFLVSRCGIYPALDLLADQVLRVLIIFGANEFVDLFGRRQVGHSLHRIGFRQNARVFYCNLSFQVATVGTPVAFDHM